MWKILRHQRALASDTCQCPVIHFIFKRPTLNSFSQLVLLYHMLHRDFPREGFWTPHPPSKVCKTQKCAKLNVCKTKSVQNSNVCKTHLHSARIV